MPMERQRAQYASATLWSYTSEARRQGDDVSEEDVPCLRDVESEAHARRIEQFGKGLKDRDRLRDREAIRARRLAARLGGQHEVDDLDVEKGFRGRL